MIAICKRCGELKHCEDVPLNMGYSERICRACYAAAVRIGDVV